MDGGRRVGNSTAIDGLMARTAMDNATTTRRQLDGEGRCDGDSMAMNDEEWRNCDGNVGTAGGGRDKGQRGIKT